MQDCHAFDNHQMASPRPCAKLYRLWGPSASVKITMRVEQSFSGGMLPRTVASNTNSDASWTEFDLHSFQRYATSSQTS